MWAHEQHHNRARVKTQTLDCALKNISCASVSGDYLWADHTLISIKNLIFPCFSDYFAYKTYKIFNLPPI